MQGNSTSTNASATVINGRGVNRRKLSRRQRIQLAADVVIGARSFVPSYEQAAVLFGVPRHRLSRYLKARRAAAAHSEAAVGNGNGETLAEHIARSSAAERLEAARIIGPAVLWDEMIEPVVSLERGVS
jgi:hypothetical protein